MMHLEIISLILRYLVCAIVFYDAYKHRETMGAFEVNVQILLILILISQ